MSGHRLDNPYQPPCRRRQERKRVDKSHAAIAWLFSHAPFPQARRGVWGMVWDNTSQRADPVMLEAMLCESLSTAGVLVTLLVLVSLTLVPLKGQNLFQTAVSDFRPQTPVRAPHD